MGIPNCPVRCWGIPKREGCGQGCSWRFGLGAPRARRNLLQKVVAPYIGNHVFFFAWGDMGPGDLIKMAEKEIGNSDFLKAYPTSFFQSESEGLTPRLLNHFFCGVVVPFYLLRQIEWGISFSRILFSKNCIIGLTIEWIRLDYWVRWGEAPHFWVTSCYCISKPSFNFEFWSCRNIKAFFFTQEKLGSSSSVFVLWTFLSWYFLTRLHGQQKNPGKLDFIWITWDLNRIPKHFVTVK